MLSVPLNFPLGFAFCCWKNGIKVFHPFYPHPTAPLTNSSINNLFFFNELCPCRFKQNGVVWSPVLVLCAWNRSLMLITKHCVTVLPVWDWPHTVLQAHRFLELNYETILLLGVLTRLYMQSVWFPWKTDISKYIVELIIDYLWEGEMRSKYFSLGIFYILPCIAIISPIKL